MKAIDVYETLRILREHTAPTLDNATINYLQSRDLIAARSYTSSTELYRDHENFFRLQQELTTLDGEKVDATLRISGLEQRAQSFLHKLFTSQSRLSREAEELEQAKRNLQELRDQYARTACAADDLKYVTKSTFNGYTSDGLLRYVAVTDAGKVALSRLQQNLGKLDHMDYDGFAATMPKKRRYSGQTIIQTITMGTRSRSSSISGMMDEAMTDIFDA